VRQFLPILGFLFVLFGLFPAPDGNLLRNGDFAEVTDGQLPAHWGMGVTVKQKVSVVPDKGPDGKGALQVGIRNTHEQFGEITQGIKADPNTAYVLSGSIRSTAFRQAFLQVRLYRDGRRLGQVRTVRSSQSWRSVEQVFHTGRADSVNILCRYMQGKEMVGQTAWFANVSVVKAPPPGPENPVAVATFEAIGIRVPCGGAPKPTDRMSVRYRRKVDARWQDGLPLFYCPTDNEFRGSLVDLEPGTVYEIECWLAKTPEKLLRLSAETWSEEIPVAEVRTLPAGPRKEPLIIRDQGGPDGWIVYRPAAGQQAVIDVGDRRISAVFFDQASYVMIEGLTIRGGRRNGVNVWGSHHIRVRGCDIANWGDPGIREEGPPGGPHVDARRDHVGVRVSGGSRQVVVERNFIHSPNGTANSWEYGHPAGPLGIRLDRTGGNNVVRHNDIVGSETHWWNDAIESNSNGSVTGGPYQDTDIYGNVLAFSNDDGTELDGGQINVRFHRNWIVWALCGISHAPNISGPSYSFRNLISGLGEERLAVGSAFKMGGNLHSLGMNVILHNTVYGAGGGLQSVGFGKGKDSGAYIAYSRNNVFADRVGGAGGIGGDVTNISRDPRNDFDHDLTSRSKTRLTTGGEEHAVTEAPVFLDPERGDFRFAKGSAGLDQAVPLPGFNDRSAGKGPDMGALEAGMPDTACFPPRPGGMTALPCRTRLRHVAGKTTRQVIALRAPRALGTRWIATTNAPWLRCEPASGSTADAVQEVHVGPVASLQEQRLHRGAVTFRTDQGYTRTVLVDARVCPEHEVTVVVEAESATIGGAFQKVAEPTASKGFFVHAPEASEQVEGVGHRQSQPGTLTFTFGIPEDGVYYLMGRCMILGPRAFAVDHDSFHFAIDSGDKICWDLWTLPRDRWAWSQARARTKGHSLNPLPLKAGTHTLVIHSREPLTRIDRVALTNDPHGPPPRD
jgi:hypothetical protein